MKKSVLMIFGFAALIACNNGQKNNTNTSENNTTDSNNLVLVEDKTWEEKDIMDFVQKASNGGEAEVEMSKMAEKKSMEKSVKDLAKLVDTDHAEANTKLKAALKAMQLNAPTTMKDKYKDKINDLQQKKGKGFDKAYVDYLVDDHEEDIEDFEKAQNKLPDSELKSWVSNTLPAMRKHLAEAKFVQKQLKNDNDKSETKSDENSKSGTITEKK